MNGNNVGRIEGENRDLGQNREDFKSALDVEKNPDTGEYPQGPEERSEQINISSPEERETVSSGEDGDLEKRRERRKKTYRRVVNGVVLGSMLSQAGGSTATMANAQREGEKKEDNVAPVKEQYHEDVTKESTEDNKEFSFLDPSVGSGLDSEGFAKEETAGEKELQGGVLDERESVEGGESTEFALFESVEEFEEIIPSVEELMGYRFISNRSHKKEGTPVRVNSNMLTIMSFPAEESLALGNELKVFSLETEELKEVMNSQRKVDWTYRYNELEGFAFEVDSFVSLVGPKGDLIEFGKVRTTDQMPLYLLMKYTDTDNKEYEIGTLDWDGYQTQNFGEEKNMTSFENFTENFYKALNSEKNSSFVSKEIYGGATSEKIFNLLYESSKLRELEIIAEHNRDVKVVLGISNAINGYMREVGESGDYDPDSFARYVLNYVDSGGDSWYKDFFEMHMDWFHYTTDYENETQLMEDLREVVKIGPNGEKGIDKYKLFEVYSQLIGLNSPTLDPLKEEEIRNKILQGDFEQSPIQIPLEEGNFGYLYKGDRFSMDKVLPGDILFPDWLVFKIYHSREKDGSFNLWVVGIDERDQGDRVRIDSINSRKGNYLIDTLVGEYLFRSSWWEELLQ
jgi:hypothetical protein